MSECYDVGIFMGLSGDMSWYCMGSLVHEIPGVLSSCAILITLIAIRKSLSFHLENLIVFENQTSAPSYEDTLDLRVL